MTGLGEWDDPAGGQAPDAEQPAQLYYPTVDAFVADLLAGLYRREVDGRHRVWCPEWWRHAEAVTRLEALWRAWEHLRLDPATGMSVWLRDHADHHMAVLLSPDGPFKGCSREKGHSSRLAALPLAAPPAGLFTLAQSLPPATVDQDPDDSPDEAALNAERRGLTQPGAVHRRPVT